MKRELEFKMYLIKNNKNKKYITYCKNIEKAFGGLDIDEIISSHQKISKVQDNLRACGTGDGCIKSYMSGLNSYLTFSASYKAFAPVICSGGRSKLTDLVTYENSVPESEEITGLCEFLEDEYEKVRAFASNVLLGVLRDFPAIPVYLSEKCPTKTHYCDREFLLGKMRERCVKCQRENCQPPYCSISGVLEQYAPFTYRIGGEFYGGEEPRIVIYFKNFDKPSMHNEMYLAQIVKTLAHEYMHFLHYYYVKTVAPGVTDPLWHESLSEALADFFGVLYSLKRGTTYDVKVAQERYKMWKKRFHSGWPYSYALYFVNHLPKPLHTDYDDYYKYGSVCKLVDVFKKTSKADEAFDLLTR